MNAQVKLITKFFKTDLPDHFEIKVDQSNGTKIEITPELIFENEWSNKDGLDMAMVSWLNYEFKNNPSAQHKLKEIKKLALTNSGHIAITNFGNCEIITVDLFHTMCVISSMGYDIHCNWNKDTKKVTSFSLSKT